MSKRFLKGLLWVSQSVSEDDLLGGGCEDGGRLGNELGRWCFSEMRTLSPAGNREGSRLKLQGRKLNCIRDIHSGLTAKVLLLSKFH